MKLSIIIPYFNTKEYTDELLACLDKQMNDDVEVILIDDGSDSVYRPKYDWLRVHRVKHSGQSKARNLGINRALGDYIQFIDSDDMVPEYFIEKLLEKISEGSELIEYSWRSLNMNGVKFNYRVYKDGDRLSNPSACTRCFKRDFIGSHRFNEKKDATEDEDFTRHLGIYRDVKVSIIPEYMYFYRTDVQGSNVKTYKQGLRKTKRVVYYYKHVGRDRDDILKAIKEDDKTNEVFLMTYQNDIPELEEHCQILRPCNIWTHYQKGEPFTGCSIVQIPEQYKTIVYIQFLHIIGGIETFVYNFGDMLGDAVLLIGRVNDKQKERLKEKIKVIEYDRRKTYLCETLIILRILDDKPENILCDQSVRMVHGCRTNPSWHVRQDTDFIVTVSETCKKSFGEECKEAMVIHNPITKENKKALILVSATRIPAPDKGNNETRMRILAERLKDADIPFVWFNFSDGVIQNAPEGLVNMGTRMDIQPYIARADYLVQLSDSEAWSYSMLEALVNGTAVLCTPLASAEEMGIEDGVNGYILPYDMGFDVNRLLDVPTFEYEYDNDQIKALWSKLLSKKIKPPKKQGVRVRVLTTYNDTQLKRQVNAGEVIFVKPDRAKQIASAGLGEII